MDKNCNKYEILTNFGSDEELLAHIEECEICKAEHEKIKAVTGLIQEAKPYYLKQKNVISKAKIACVMIFTLFTGISAGVLNANFNLIDTLSYNDGITLEDMGFPTDDYGLIMVD